jgi:DNA-binding transcriptional LysR family regulator
LRPTQRSLIVRKAGVVAFAMYASRKYLTLHGAPSSREDLGHHHLIAYRDAVAYVDAYKWTNALSDRVAFRATDATSMLDAVVAGLGIGVLPCCLAAGVPGVMCLEAVGPPAPEVIWLVTHPDTVEIARVRAVARWLLEIIERNANSLAGRERTNVQ